MSCEIIIRRAGAADWAARASLIHTGLAAYQREAFLLFYFQELTLELGVLAGALLFIFCGASLRMLALLPVIAALIVALLVKIAHTASAHKHSQDIRRELVGFVAELRGPLLANSEGLRPAIVHEREGGLQDSVLRGPVHRKVVGTVSVSEFWGPQDSGWLHALAVDPQWQRRGAGLALLAAARSWAVGEGRASLETASSELQVPALSLMRAAGWHPRGIHHRRLAGPALTLLLHHLGLDIANV